MQKLQYSPLLVLSGLWFPCSDSNQGGNIVDVAAVFALVMERRKL